MSGKPEHRMRTTIDANTRQGYTVPAGSSVIVIRENKQTIYARWPSMYGTFHVTLPKRAFK